VKVLPKIGKVRPMDAAAEMLDGARPKLAYLVKRQAIISGSRTRAEIEVGAMIGRSDSWIRKLLGRTLDTKRPDAVVLQNIHAIYSRICAGIENAADARFAHALELLDKTNAATAGDQKVDQGMAGRAPAPAEIGADDPQQPDPMEFPAFLKRVK
jgi:hypothetical protein